MNGGSVLRPEQVAAVVDALEADGIPFAIGGAVALGYASEPRATFDLDINIFLNASSVGDVFRTLRERLDFEFDETSARRDVERDFQVRIDWNGTFLDLFFAFSTFHEGVERRTHRCLFAGKEIPVLSPEDLVCFKVMFNRSKDWVDVEKLLYFRDRDFDRDYVKRTLSDILGADDSGLIRLDELMRTVHEDAGKE
jgi:predicted nucleotidyltransferase